MVNIVAMKLLISTIEEIYHHMCVYNYLNINKYINIIFTIEKYVIYKVYLHIWLNT